MRSDEQTFFVKCLHAFVSHVVAYLFRIYVIVERFNCLSMFGNFFKMALSRISRFKKVKNELAILLNV